MPLPTDPEALPRLLLLWKLNTVPDHSPTPSMVLPLLRRCQPGHQYSWDETMSPLLPLRLHTPWTGRRPRGPRRGPSPSRSPWHTQQPARATRPPYERMAQTTHGWQKRQPAARREQRTKASWEFGIHNLRKSIHTIPAPHLTRGQFHDHPELLLEDNRSLWKCGGVKRV